MAAETPRAELGGAPVRPLRLSRSSVAMACAGLLVTAVLVGLDLWRAAEVREAQFGRRISEFTAAVEDRYNRSLAYQRAVNAHFLASHEVDRGEFARFLSLEAGLDSPFRSLQYIPWIRADGRAAYEQRLREAAGIGTGIWEYDADGAPRAAGARDDYFPIHFVYPETAPSLEGFDAGSEPTRRQTLELAGSTGRTAATPPVRLLRRLHDWGFLVVAPIDRGAVPCTTAQECRSTITGFTIGVYGLADLLAKPLQLLPSGISLYVFADRGADAHPVYAHPGRATAPAAAVATRSALDAAGADWRTFRVAQQEWELAFVGPGAVAGSMQTVALLALGLSLTLAIVLGQKRVLKHVRALQESERQRATLISNLPGFVYRVANEPSWPMFFVSDGVHAVTGYRPADLLAGQPTYGDLIVAQDRDRVWHDVQTALDEGRRFQTEYRITTADQQTRWVWEQGCGVRDDGGRLSFLEGFVTDITERRRTQEQLSQADKQEAIGLLTGGLAHDFNNALGVVIGFLDLAAARAGSDEKLRQYLDSAMAAALRGANVTKSLLAVARQQPLDFKDFDPNAAIREMMSLIRQIVGPGTRVVEAFADEPLVAHGDPGGLSHAILNLVINARDAMPDGGQLVVETALRSIDAGAPEGPMLTPGQYVVVAVRDSGTGMTPEVAARAFEPYFTTKERGKGTGLGLAMVHGYAQQSGGTATLYSRLGEGTVVRIYLPAGQPLEGTAAEVCPVAVGTTRAERVLIVDDEAELAQVAREWLRGFGYHAEAVTGAEAALARLREGRWDLLVTDIVMPGMDGLELVRQARAANPGLHVVLTSGFSDKAAATPELASRILPKPYRRHELGRAVRDALDAPPLEIAGP